MNIIVTGSSEGLGLALAEKYLSEGHNVLITSSNNNKLNKAYVYLSDKVIINNFQLYFFKCDIANNKEAKKLISYANNIFLGKIDVLVNNAAQIGPVGEFSEIDLKQIENLFKINFFGICNLTKLILPYFKRNKNITSIINIGGSNSYNPDPRFIGYSASKAALLAFTLSLSKEIEYKYNTNINYVLPGSMNTPMNDKKLNKGIKKLGNELYTHFINRKNKNDGDSILKAVNFIYNLSKIKISLSGKILSAQFDELDKIINLISKNKDAFTLLRVNK